MPGASRLWCGTASWWKFHGVEPRRAPTAFPGREFDPVEAAPLGNVARSPSPLSAVLAYRAVAERGVHGGGFQLSLLRLWPGVDSSPVSAIASRMAVSACTFFIR